jgi:integrase/recombinase XerD
VASTSGRPGRDRRSASPPPFLVRYPPPTRAEYARDLRSFAAWCGGIGVELLGVERAHVERWVRHLLEEQGRRPSTVRRRLAVLQGFYAEATDQGVIGRAPTIRVRRPRLRDPQRLGLDRHQAHALLAAAEAAGPRDHALVCLLLLNGLRVSEAVGARAGDLSTARGHRLLRIVRKGGPVVEVPLAPRTARAVDAHLVERSLTPGDPGSPLLASGSGEPMSRHAASRAVLRLAQRAGIDGPVRPHLCRHAFVTAALDAGVALRDVQDAAGQADPKTTVGYDRGRHSLDRHATYAVATFLG